MNLDKSISVFDPVVTSKQPKYTVIKGCLSTNNVKFTSLTRGVNSSTFNVQVPSQNVFVDRKVSWTTELILKCELDHKDFKADSAPGQGNNPDADTKLNAQLGVHIAPNAFPAHRLIHTASVQINDTVTTITSSDVLNPLLLLQDLRPDQEVNSTCPSYISKYAKHADGYGAGNNAIAGFYDQNPGYKPPNGAYGNFQFCKADGGDILAAGNDIENIDGVEYKFVDGVPVVMALPGAGANIRPVYKFHIKIKTTELLRVSPFIFHLEKLNSTGLFGVNNMQITLNYRASPTDLLQFIPTKLRGAGADFPELKFSLVSQKTNELNLMFHTPPLDLKLPSLNIVPYTQFPRYITTGLSIGTDAKSVNFRSATITLPSIPDCLIVLIKKTSYTLVENEFYFPISKLNVTFDNFSGLCSSYTQEQLYQMSYRNGLRMDINTFLGHANTPRGGVQTIGGFLILRMGIDIPLSTSQAPGVAGNYTLSVECSVQKPKSVANVAFNDLQMVIITPSSGFFATSNGSSQIVLNPLTEKDVLSAKPTMSSNDMESLTYGGGFFDNLAHSATKYGKMLGDAGKKIVSNPKVQDAVLRIGEKALQKKLGLGANSARGNIGGGGRKTGGLKNLL